MQKLLLNDYPKIKKYLDDADYEGYNSNFVTMMMWDHEYQIYYETHDHFMIMLHTYLNEKFFSMPFCKLEYYHEAIEYMINYAHKHNFPFKINMAVENSMKKIKQIYGNKFLYLHNIDNDDYIYSKKSLQTLSGKKMQKRRNHYNAFIKQNPNYIYKEIEEQDIDNVLECLKKWNYSHQIEESTISEYIGIIYLLVHRHELNIKTGCIYINNQLEAFIIGSPLKHSTVQIHIEKANKDIRGLYAAICKFFLERNFDGYELVNREEDMGLESLRRSKQMLHPIKMINKYNIVENKLSIVKATDDDLHQIIDLWRDSFKDENTKTTNYYFINHYNKENTYLLKNVDTLVSMMQIIPYKIIIDKIETTSYFILGVATKKDYQGQGMMKYLINYVISLPQYIDQKILLQAYKPPIYYNLGFRENYFIKRTLVNKEKYKVIHSVNPNYNFDILELLDLYNDYIINFNGYKKRDLDYYENYLIRRCEAYDEKILVFYEYDKSIGYIIYSETDNDIIISEFIYQNHDALNNIISYLATSVTKNLIIESDLNADIHGESTFRCNMMTNFLNNEQMNNDLYINECL